MSLTEPLLMAAVFLFLMEDMGILGLLFVHYPCINVHFCGMSYFLRLRFGGNTGAEGDQSSFRSGHFSAEQQKTGPVPGGILL